MTAAVALAAPVSAGPAAFGLTLSRFDQRALTGTELDILHALGPAGLR